ncbi:unnamed protein product [Merluccius merluccius]
MDRTGRRLGSRLCEAVMEEDPRSVQMLLSQGASPNLVASKGVAAVHLAVGKETEKSIRCLKLLLQHGADPNVRSSEGLTPLHVAALWGCYQNVKLLLANGGNPNVTDQEGNTPGQFAEQQDNRKCAQLLQNHQAQSADLEEDPPHFQYSIYSDQTDISSYPDSDSSLSSRLSMISDFGEDPLSSTRHSALFDRPVSNYPNPRWRGGHLSRPVDMDPNGGGLGRDWNINKDWMCGDGPSFLSSTRMSTVGCASTKPVPQEDVTFGDEVTWAPNTSEGPSLLSSTRMSMAGPVLHNRPAANKCRLSILHRDAPTATIAGTSGQASRRASRKSVGFREVDEYFPILSAESPEPPVDSLPFDPSEYSDSERLVTVLHKQGIDVTSPDHVYVFDRDSSKNTDVDMDKTVFINLRLEEGKETDEEEEEEVRGQTRLVEQPPHSVASSSSGSHYSSCDSDHYATAHGGLLRVSCSSSSEEEARERALKFEAQHPTDSALRSQDVQIPARRRSEQEADSKLDRLEDEDSDLPFTPSPFVTGRTRSRLSRCSMRTSRMPESVFSTTSLFEETLPTPVRTRRQTPRSQSSDDVFYNSPHMHGYVPPRSTGDSGSSLTSDHLGTQSSSGVGDSQADTFILPRGGAEAGPPSQSLPDTIILERKPDSSTIRCEEYLKDIAPEVVGKDMTEGEEEEFLTDDQTSTDTVKPQKKPDDAVGAEQLGSLKNREVSWITEGSDTHAESGSSSSSASSSSSCYFSPRRSRENSETTGYTPRYSMSRLSLGLRRSQNHLAPQNHLQTYTPCALDLDEPVEYLYTDTEQGHELIETHIPPTANTSLSTSSSDETVLYDFQSLRADLMRTKGGKENQTPQKRVEEAVQLQKKKKKVGEEKEKKEEEAKGCNLLPETKGITDKELRRRLLELGESPGPISTRTRPVYMQRLCRLILESNTQSHQQQHKQLDPSHTDSGYSLELSRALRTFDLPDCHAAELELCQQFDQPDQNKKWREGVIKSSFNYLLLDPRVTKNLPYRSRTMSPHECFQTFVHAIFYVGKGKRSRPYSHLYEALEYFKGDKTSKKLCSKVQHILQVWTGGQGVISLHCFQNVIPVEAFTREACMVDAIGLKMLTNKKRGDYYGVVSTWQARKRRDLGVHLLHRAMQIFLAEGERQLRPADIKR